MRVLSSLVVLLAAAPVLATAPSTLSLTPGAPAGEPAFRVLDRHAGGLVLELQIPTLEVADVDVGGRTFQEVAVPGGGFAGEVGRAALPTCSRLVALPAGRGVQVTLLGADEVPLPRLDLAPAQPVVEAGRTAAALDAAWYASAAPTAPSVTVGEPAIMHGQRVAAVTFCPLRYDPRTGEASAARTMTVEVTFAGDDARNDPAGAPRAVPASFAALFADAVVGWDRDGEVLADPGTYLVVCPDNAAVVAAVQPLVDWRARQGYHTVVATTAQTGTTAAAIKAFLQAQYDTLEPPLEFVTLVGDANGAVSLPCWFENLSGYSGEGDHDYALLEGSDILADVHVGRLSAGSVTELQAIVNKIVAYESDPDLSQTGWFRAAGLTGDPSSSGYSCIWVNQFVKESLQHLGYSRIDTIWSGNFLSQMMASINQGETLFTYRGYIGMSGMGASHIAVLSNGRKLPYAVVMTCGTGGFSSEGNCRSEAFLRAPNGGGIAAVGTATSGTHTRYNNCIFLGVTHGVLNTGEHRLGPSLTRGKLNLYTNYHENEPNQARIWAHWNNLMGDPATEMWTGVPATLQVSHPAELSLGANALPVTVRRDGQPVAGALVTAYQAGHVRSSALTDGNGAVVLPLEGAQAGALQVTVTGHDLRPYLGATTLGAVASSLDLAAIAMDDGAGNGDGLANPGEALGLAVQLANPGTVALPAVTATLSSPLPWVHVTTPTRSFGNVPAGGAAWSAGDFGLTLGADAPGGANAPLRLVATSGTQSWTSLVDLAVAGPRGELAGATFGGPGGTLDPGETGALTFALRNGGDLATAGATATLSCNSNWVTVTDATGSFGAMAPGGETAQGDPFAIAIAGDCYPGHLANFVVDLQFAEGGTGVVEFTAVVGTAGVGDPTGPDAYGYHIFDDQDPDANAPAAGWLDIAAIGENTGIVDAANWDDDVATFDLPFSFRMYGESFDEVSICSNGWLALGRTYQRLYRNWHLPSDGGPGHMICAFWDDLAGGAIYTYHDVAQHRYIVQWDGFGTSTGYDYTGDCTFQVILYDPAYHGTPTGDGPIELRYQSVTVYGDETTYFTTGLQNGDRTTGVTYAYGNRYAGGAATLAPGRALRIVPIVPQVQGLLRGAVTNASGGGPIPGATITVVGAGRQLVTAADGRYVGNAPVGTWDVAVFHPSCPPDTTRDVVIQEAVAAVVDFTLPDVRGPAFSGTTALPSTGDTVGPYVVETTLTDLTGVADRRLYYTSSTTGGPHEASLTYVDLEGGVVRGAIPGQPLGSRVQYWLTAVDVVGNASAEPLGAPWPTFVFQVDEPTPLAQDDMESDTGWQVNVDGLDGATTGIWTRVDPALVVDVDNASRVVSPADDHTPAPGVTCWVTGQDAEGADQGGNDVDGGATTLYSPVFDLSDQGGATISYWRWYTNDTGNNPGQDVWRVQATDDGASWVDLEATTASERAWVQRSFALGDHVDLTATVRLRFVAEDASPGSLVEALVDDVALEAVPLIADLAAPTVTFLHPVEGTFGAGEEVAISWQAQDDVGVVEARVSFVIDGVEHPVAAGPHRDGYAFVWNDHFADLPTPATGRFRVAVLDGAQRQAVATAAGDVTFGTTTGVDDALPAAVVLDRAHPNPFNPRTAIHFALPRPQAITLRIYDLQGRLVRTLAEGPHAAGPHEAVWEGRDDRGGQAPSGTYLVRLRSEEGELTGKMLLVK